MSRPLSKAFERYGFTLIELVLVLVILSIMMGVAIWSLRGHFDSAKIAQAFDVLEQADQYARSIALRENRVYRMIFRDKTSTIEVLPESGSGARRSRTWKLPNGIGLARFRGPRGFSGSGRNEVSIAATGVSPTYAIQLRRGSEPGPWLVALGLSAYRARLDSKAEIDVYFPR